MRHIGAVPRFLQITVLSAAFLLPGWQAEAADKNGLSTVLGSGNISCAKWIEDKQSGPSQYNYAHVQALGWMSGYLSAYNKFVWNGSDVSSETDADGLSGWMDNFCAANPTKKVSQATQALITFLSSGPHPNDK
jgi:hypothetical protein